MRGAWPHNCNLSSQTVARREGRKEEESELLKDYPDI
jgi:hypothetical protein